MVVKLSEEVPVIHDDCSVERSELGRFVEIGRGTRLAGARFGDYSYCDRMCDISNVEIGKFANIASFVRIGATDHPLDRASLHHFMYRSADYWEDAERDEDWFAQRARRLAYIGHDTWIGHNAQIKPEVTVGHGAVVASGAIVTRDVAPYTIVAGVAADPQAAAGTGGRADDGPGLVGLGARSDPRRAGGFSHAQGRGVFGEIRLVIVQRQRHPVACEPCAAIFDRRTIRVRVDANRAQDRGPFGDAQLCGLCGAGLFGGDAGRDAGVVGHAAYFQRRRDGPGLPQRLGQAGQAVGGKGAGRDCNRFAIGK